MAAAHFLARKPYRKVRLLFINHGTPASHLGEIFLKEYGAEAVGAVELRCENINTVVPSRVSIEEHWRNERYKIFKSVAKETGSAIVTAHHLDDCTETYLFNMLNGKHYGIPYAHGPVIRPFLMTRKNTLQDWCIKNNLFWIEDESNQDCNYMRNYIRHKLLPVALGVNPGLHKIAARHSGLDW